jgi:hypothetical protein
MINQKIRKIKKINKINEINNNPLTQSMILILINLILREILLMKTLSFFLLMNKILKMNSFIKRLALKVLKV